MTAPQSSPKQIAPKTYLKWSARLVLLAWIIWFVSYSIEQYNLQGAAEGIVVCDQTSCILTTHIHADIEFDLCGQNPTLPRETGPLDGLHIHKEKNYLHFHDKINLDTARYRETGEKIWQFEKSLTIQEVIDVFALHPKTYCQTESIIIEVLVNDLPAPGGLLYNWKDGDTIKLIYKTK